jgi:CDP-paratose 2-epimerase
MRTVVFRMSCIYGPHQLGNEDQGWVAHFLLQARARRPVTLFGDGCQVRDVLFVADLVEALTQAMSNADRIRGQVFNIGGGTANCVSLLELLAMIGDRLGLPADIRHADWRCGDQRYYVTNPAKFKAATGWSPRTSVETGIAALNEWFGSALPRPRERHEGERSVTVARR